ncbi:MAG: PaaI family thioesterase [Actinomycetota bacterium]
MPLPLTNDRWAYETNCFVCEPSNPAGLQIPFLLADEADHVFADFSLGSAHSGAPTLVHGGVSLALLDEAQAWACIAIAGQWALTHTTSSTFEQPVFVDHEHRVEARIESTGGPTLTTSAVIVDATGAVCVRSQASFHVLGPVDPDQRALGLGERYRHLLGDQRPEG